MQSRWYFFTLLNLSSNSKSWNVLISSCFMPNSQLKPSIFLLHSRFVTRIWMAVCYTWLKTIATWPNIGNLAHVGPSDFLTSTPLWGIEHVLVVQCCPVAQNFQQPLMRRSLVDCMRPATVGGEIKIGKGGTNALVEATNLTKILIRSKLSSISSLYSGNSSKPLCKANHEICQIET